MSGLPQEIKIGAIYWEIVQRNEELDRGNNWGLTSPRDMTIAVDTRTSMQKQRLILLHEMLHAVDYSFFPKGHNLTETQVEMLAHALMAVLVDNPTLVDFLSGRNLE